VGASVTLEEEIELARRYLDIEAVRFGPRLKVRWEIEPAVHAARVPPLVLQPLVENAVRHGIDPSEAGGRIEVGARREVGGVRLWVADTGRGIDETQVPGTGLANLRERLASTFGARATLSLQAVQPHGVRAEIELRDGAAP
jgi:LytS/YehU family sensor histidine kinase